MKTFFYNKKISGILGILPETLKYYEEEMKDGNSTRNQMIKKNMGYGRRYRAKKTTTTADLCVEGLNYLLHKNYINKEEIGAVIVMTFTPDYYVPQVSNLIHGKCGLAKDVFTMDIWAGCSGYIEGLMQAFMFLEMNTDKKVLLFTSDIINRMGDTPDIYDEAPYGGDGASITIIENTPSPEIPLMLKSDGKASDLITFKQGAFADMYHQIYSPIAQNNPAEAFRFFQERVPNIIEDLLEYGSVKKEEIDYYFLIHANKLASIKIADKLNVDRNLVSSDIVERYGDLSASLNPISIVDYYGEEMLRNQKKKVVLCGYGAGARWGAIVMELGNMICCENYYTNL